MGSIIASDGRHAKPLMASKIKVGYKETGILYLRNPGDGTVFHTQSSSQEDAALSALKPFVIEG